MGFPTLGEVLCAFWECRRWFWFRLFTFFTFFYVWYVHFMKVRGIWQWLSEYYGGLNGFENVMQTANGMVFIDVLGIVRCLEWERTSFPIELSGLPVRNLSPEFLCQVAFSSVRMIDSLPFRALSSGWYIRFLAEMVAIYPRNCSPHETFYLFNFARGETGAAADEDRQRGRSRKKKRGQSWFCSVFSEGNSATIKLATIKGVVCMSTQSENAPRSETCLDSRPVSSSRCLSSANSVFHLSHVWNSLLSSPSEPFPITDNPLTRLNSVCSLNFLSHSQPNLLTLRNSPRRGLHFQFVL